MQLFTAIQEKVQILYSGENAVYVYQCHDRDQTVTVFLTLTLCLDGVEERELVLVERLEGRVPESSHRQRLQIQQLSGRWVLLWQDQVTERHWKLCLTG